MHFFKLVLVLLIISTGTLADDYGEDGQTRITYVGQGIHLISPEAYAHAKEIVFIISDDRVETRLAIHSKGLYYTLTIGPVTTITDSAGRTFLSNAYTHSGPIVFIEFTLPDAVADEPEVADITFWLWMGAQLAVLWIFVGLLGCTCYARGHKKGQSDVRAQMSQTTGDAEMF